MGLVIAIKNVCPYVCACVIDACSMISYVIGIPLDFYDFCLIFQMKAAQQIMELQEAAQINLGLQPANINRSSSLHDLKAIVKTWRFVCFLYYPTRILFLYAMSKIVV